VPTEFQHFDQVLETCTVLLCYGTVVLL